MTADAERGRRWSDGRLGRALRVLQLLTSTGTLVALVLAVIAISDSTGSRRTSAHDSCELLRGLVLAATSSAPKQRAAAETYMSHTPLRNCNLYARTLVR